MSNASAATSDNDRVTVLVVDDEPNIVMALEFLLKKAGYHVEKAENGVDALARAKAVKPAVAILDVMMPGINGFEVARQIRLNPGLEQTRIIFLTAKGTPDDKRKGYSSGGEYYIVKPFDNEEIITAVNDIMVYG